MTKNRLKNQLKPILLLVGIFAVSHFSLLAQTISNVNILTSVCIGGSGTAQISFTGATYPFTLDWYGSGIANGSATITGSPQTITISATSGMNWSNDGMRASFTVNQIWKGRFPVGITFDPSNNSYLQPTCAAGATLNLSNITGGVAPYTLGLRDNVSNTTIISGNAPLNIPYSIICPNSGNVSIVVTDANGCAADIDSIYIDCNGLRVSTNVTPASCTNGTATIGTITGGVAPYTYLWSNGATTSSITGLISGYYTCTVTDANGCTGQGYASIQQNPRITINTTRKNATCNNFDGEATAFPVGGSAPYTYLWQNGATTKIATGLQSGNHKVVVTDANGCTGTGWVFVASTSPVYASFSTTNSSCTSSTGTATLNVSGGQTPYTYSWNGNPSTSSVATGLGQGRHGFMVTDANGCERRGVVTISPVSNLRATISKTNAICPSSNGKAVVNASSSAPITYLWSNSATTSTISNIAPGSYSCVIKDDSGCQISKSITVRSTSPIIVGFNTVIASCLYNADGSITASGSNGTAPYTYKWSTGATTATISGLKKGWYSVTVKDANNCSQYKRVYLGYNASDNSCYCTVDGIVYEDLNSNCVQDAGELGLDNISMKLNGFGITSTNSSGYYSFKVPVGSYTLEQLPAKGINLTSCQSNNIAIAVSSVSSGCKQTNNFADSLTPLHDIHIYTLNSSAPVPGNNYNQKIIIKNRGTVNETNVSVGYKNDGQLTWQNNNGVPLVSAGTNYHQLTGLILPRGNTKNYYLDYYTPTNIPLGTIVYFVDSAAYRSPVKLYWETNEETPWNNLDDRFVTVRSSYDPNFKEVAPKGVDADGKIALTEKDFRYVIHFENNGTAPAQKVVVTDTLDADLDLTTFRVLNSTHSVVPVIDESRVLTFTFDNINLDYTPKNVFKASAQGHVAFTISAKESVEYGDVINNNADIYFDYNAPIRTNTVTNTYFDFSSGIKAAKQVSESINLYPNPSSGLVNFKLPSNFDGLTSISVYNLQGQLLKNMETNQSEIDLTSLGKGMFLVQFTGANGQTGNGKIVIQ